MICRDNKQTSRGCDLIEKAALYYLQNGTPDTAAMAMNRAGKMIEQEDPDKAMVIYRRAADIVENEDRPREAAVFVGKVARLLMRLKRYEEAIPALNHEIAYYSQCEDVGMNSKLVMGLVMLHLQTGDYVAADKAFQSCLRLENFAESDEAPAIQRLLTAYDEGDQEEADKQLKSPLFRYMENDFTILARDLKVPGGRKKMVGMTADLEIEGEDESEDASLLL